LIVYASKFWQTKDCCLLNYDITDTAIDLTNKPAPVKPSRLVCGFIRSFYRNPLIMQMLVDYGYADKIGRGIMSIIKYHEKNRLKSPEFEKCGFEFRVRVWKRE
jgi:predicted HTH transcriptional regulator